MKTKVRNHTLTHSSKHKGLNKLCPTNYRHKFKTFSIELYTKKKKDS